MENNKEPHSLAVTYHSQLADIFQDWAAAAGYNSIQLRINTEQAIRTRHHEAFIEHESHKASGTQPDVFTLSLGSIDVYYTIEPPGVVVRGYAWEIQGEPLDDYDGGGFYPEASWVR